MKSSDMVGYKNSRIRSLAVEGMPLKDELIIDSHAHIGLMSDVHIPYGKLKGIISHMNHLGIDQLCISAYAGLFADYKLGNDLVARAVRDYPTRFIGFAVINPNYSEEEIQAEMRRCTERLNMRAFKLHPGCHYYPPDGPKYFPVFEYANAHSYMVLNHTWGINASYLNKVAAQFRNACFIIGHGSSLAAVRGENRPSGYEELLRKRDNVSLSLTTCYRFGEVERLVKEVGSEKVLFGTDMSYLDGASQLGTVAYARISDEDKRKILGLNMKQIIDVYARG